MCLYRFKAKITDPSPEYAQWLSQPKTLESIINFANDFTYVSDKEQFGKTDYWMTPSEFFVTKRGDCDDIHLFMADAIYRALGWESYLVIAWRFTQFPKTEAHAMTIFKRDGQYFLLNYRQIIPMNSLKDREALKKAGFTYLGAIFRMPDGKRV